jgi:hypothetical protein
MFFQLVRKHANKKNGGYFDSFLKKDFLVIPPGRIVFRKRSEWTISTNHHSKTYFFPRFHLGEKTFCRDDQMDTQDEIDIKKRISILENKIIQKVNFNQIENVANPYILNHFQFNMTQFIIAEEFNNFLRSLNGEIDRLKFHGSEEKVFLKI